MNDLVLRYAIGWTGRDPKKRYVGVITPEKPWPVYIKDIVLKDIDWLKGKARPRVMLSNPFGVVPQWPTMRATQYQDAVKAQLDWLYESFFAPVKELVDQGVEVISYLGSPKSDPYYRAFENNKATNNQDNIIYELSQSYGVSINAGCSIGFDGAQGVPPDHYQYHFMEMLRSLGVKYYIESTPQLVQTHLWDKDSIARETTFLARHVIRERIGYQTKYPAYMADNWYTCDEIIRLVLWRDAGRTAEEMIKMIRRILEDGEADGQSVASFDARQLIERAKIEDLIGD